MWLQAYNQNDLGVIIEASTQCNAACPQCQRFEIIDQLDETQWTLEDFKTLFPPEELSHYRNFHFSGTYGDPCVCNDLIPIVRYIMDNSKAFVSINTNGSMRTEEWWWELGSTIRNRGSIIFDIDGIDQEMHSRYRINTNLKKILNNMETVSMTGCQVRVFTVVFKHNQDYVDSIKEMTKNIGASEWEAVESGRKIEEGMNLEQATKGYKGNGYARKVRVEEFVREEASEEIDCAWAHMRNLNVTVDGFVHPCCYLENQTRHVPVRDNIIATDGKYSELHQNPDSFNLFKYSMKDIITNKFYSKDLEEAISSKDTAHNVCLRFCSK